MSEGPALRAKWGNFPPNSPLVHRLKNKGVMSRPRVNEHSQTSGTDGLRVRMYAHTNIAWRKAGKLML